MSGTMVGATKSHTTCTRNLGIKDCWTLQFVVRTGHHYFDSVSLQIPSVIVESEKVLRTTCTIKQVQKDNRNLVCLL